MFLKIASTGLLLATLFLARPVTAQDNLDVLGPTISTPEIKPNSGSQPQVSNHQDFEIDQSRVRAAGINKISGKYLDLYTDVRDRTDVNELIEVFDRAIPFWCEYFGIDEALVDGWKMSSMVILDKTRFQRAGLIPAGLPDFKAGYHLGHAFWLYVQDGDYYTRHLFLHEGTHAFMGKFLGGVGAPWYAEGMAELLAVHRWDGRTLEMNFRRNRREDVPYWGRVKLIRDAVEDNELLSLTDVMAAENANFAQVNWYAWSWAACRFFDSHPKYHDRFRGLKSEAQDGSIQFSAKFWESLKSEHESINREWNLFLREIDYGVDLPAMMVSPIQKNADDVLELAVDQGWQDSGVDLIADHKYVIGSRGRFILRETTKIWESEADGVSIEYYQGLPLGRLVAAVVSEEEWNQGLFKVIDVGSRTRVSGKTGRLYFKINESAADLADNKGKLEIKVVPSTK